MLPTWLNQKSERGFRHVKFYLTVVNIAINYQPVLDRAETDLFIDCVVKVWLKEKEIRIFFRKSLLQISTKLLGKRTKTKRN